jgi:hypothetical protein
MTNDGQMDLFSNPESYLFSPPGDARSNNPIVRQIKRIQPPSSMCQDSIAADHFEAISDEQFYDEDGGDW